MDYGSGGDLYKCNGLNSTIRLRFRLITRWNGKRLKKRKKKKIDFMR